MDKLSKEEFCARFKAHMVKVAGDTFGDGSSVSEYADDTAPTYFDEQYQRDAGSAESWAEEDMSYWE